MDSELFEGVDESDKAKFVGNFFHWSKCRFQDCNNLAQVKSKGHPTIAEIHAHEEKRDFQSWGSGKGHHVPSHNSNDAAYVQTGAKTTGKEVILTNTQHQVMADLKKEEAQELVKPTQLAENKKDAEPMNVQLKEEKK